MAVFIHIFLEPALSKFVQKQWFAYADIDSSFKTDPDPESSNNGSRRDSGVGLTVDNPPSNSNVTANQFKDLTLELLFDANAAECCFACRAFTGKRDTLHSGKHFLAFDH